MQAKVKVIEGSARGTWSSTSRFNNEPPVEHEIGVVFLLDCLESRIVLLELCLALARTRGFRSRSGLAAC